MGRSSAAGGDEARNPPLPVADTGGCSANEATSFASISVAKRLCRIVRPHGACACGGLLRGNASSISCRVPPAWPFLPTIAINYAPVARRCNRRGLAQPDHRGNIQGDGWRLRRSGHAEFSLPRGWGGRWPGPLPVFIQLTFTPKPVLWYFLDSRKKYRPHGKAGCIYRIFLFFCLFSSCCAVCVGAGRG